MRTDGRTRRTFAGLTLLLTMGAAVACGPRVATRGGQMNDDQGEMNFELVHRARSVVFYLEDHGQPVTTKAASALVEIQRGSGGWTAQLRPDGVNRFVANLPVGLVVGDSLTVKVSFPNGSIANGHFSFGKAPRALLPSFSVAAQVRRPSP